MQTVHPRLKTTVDSLRFFIATKPTETTVALWSIDPSGQAQPVLLAINYESGDSQASADDAIFLDWDDEDDDYDYDDDLDDDLDDDDDDLDDDDDDDLDDDIDDDDDVDDVDDFDDDFDDDIDDIEIGADDEDEI